MNVLVSFVLDAFINEMEQEADAKETPARPADGHDQDPFLSAMHRSGSQDGVLVDARALASIGAAGASSRGLPVTATFPEKGSPSSYGLRL